MIATSDAAGESLSSSGSRKVDWNVTEDWAMVGRRFMNKTGVLKVFLIGFEDHAEETIDPVTERVLLRGDLQEL